MQDNSTVSEGVVKVVLNPIRFFLSAIDQLQQNPTHTTTGLWRHLPHTIWDTLT